MTEITRPVLRYHGGKFRLAPWILQFFPPHTCYVEPFGGGASVLMLKDRCGAEVYNDLDSRVADLFRILREPYLSAELQRRVALTPYSRDEFERSYEPAVDEMDAAHKLVVRSFMGRGSDSAVRGCKTGFRSQLTEGRYLPSYEWGTWSDSIPAFTQRLAGVMVENTDGIELIARFQCTTGLVYADPPYLKATRSALKGRGAKSHGYRHELDDDGHRRLSEALHAYTGMVVVGGYPSELYESMYAGWERFQRSSVADGAQMRTEVVWLNPACSAALARARGGLFAEAA